MDIFKRKNSNETALKAFREFFVELEPKLEAGCLPVESIKFSAKMSCDNGLSTRDFNYRSWHYVKAVIRIIDGEVRIVPIDNEGEYDTNKQEKVSYSSWDFVRVDFAELQLAVVDVIEKYNTAQRQADDDYSIFQKLKISK